ncbi:hypothetical protein ACOMHN_045826 [Nucella lapillus]
MTRSREASRPWGDDPQHTSRPAQYLVGWPSWFSLIPREVSHLAPASPILTNPHLPHLPHQASPSLTNPHQPPPTLTNSHQPSPALIAQSVHTPPEESRRLESEPSGLRPLE